LQNLWISQHVHSFNLKVRSNRMSPNWVRLYNWLPATDYRLLLLELATEN
jgi:hypothetical protein